MARRGDKLSQHILYAAKSVFLEVGFERASMDLIAARAETSKRTLYAHFESKEKLFLAVIELAQEAYGARLKMPGEYSDDPQEALTVFCGRLLELLLFTWTIRMCRLSIAEAERFPDGSAQYFEAMFSQTQRRIAVYLKATFHLTPKASANAAEKLLGRLLYPAFPRALFGLEALAEDVDEERIRADFDLRPVRKIVAELIESLG